MSTTLPPVDAKALTALAETFCLALAEHPKMRRMLQRWRDTARREAMARRVLRLREPKPHGDADAYLIAANFLEIALHKAEGRADEAPRRKKAK